MIETVSERTEKDTSTMTAVEKRRAKALAKHVNRQEATRKEDTVSLCICVCAFSLFCI